MIPVLPALKVQQVLRARTVVTELPVRKAIPVLKVFKDHKVLLV